MPQFPVASKVPSTVRYRSWSAANKPISTLSRTYSMREAKPLYESGLPDPDKPSKRQISLWLPEISNYWPKQLSFWKHTVSILLQPCRYWAEDSPVPQSWTKRDRKCWTANLAQVSDSSYTTKTSALLLPQLEKQAFRSRLAQQSPNSLLQPSTMATEALTTPACSGL